MSSRKKILFALEGFLPEKRAGTETYVYNLSKALLDNGWEVVVIATSVKETESYRCENIPVHRIQVPLQEDVKTMNGLRPPGNLPRFLRLVEELQPGVVHFHSFGRAINSYHLRAVHRMGIRTVFTSHLTGIFCVKGNLMYLDREKCNGRIDLNRCATCFVYNRNRNLARSRLIGMGVRVLVTSGLFRIIKPSAGLIRFRKLEMKRLRNHADAVVCLSEWNTETYRLNGVKNTLRIRQAVPLPEIHTEIPLQEEKNSLIRLLFVGRITKIKGLHLTVKALEGRLGTCFHLTVCGIKDAREEEYYQQVRNACNGLPHVSWLEDLDQKQIGQQYAGTDLVCLPSLAAEMAPLVLVEAERMKKPVLGSDHGGIADAIVHNHNGLLHNPGDADGIRNQLSRILHDRSLLDRLAGNRTSRWSFPQLIQAHEKLYHNLLGYNDNS